MFGRLRETTTTVVLTTQAKGLGPLRAAAYGCAPGFEAGKGWNPVCGTLTNTAPMRLHLARGGDFL